MNELQYQLRLKAIQYTGDNIGSNLVFKFKIRGYGKKDFDLQRDIPHNTTATFKNLVLNERRINQPFTQSIFAEVFEDDLLDDKGSGGNKVKVTFAPGKQSLQVKVKVVGDPIGDADKTANLVLDFEIEKIALPIRTEEEETVGETPPFVIPSEPGISYPGFIEVLSETQNKVIAFISDLHIGADKCVDDFDSADDADFITMMNYLDAVRNATTKKTMDLVIVGDFLELWETKTYANPNDDKKEQIAKAKFKIDKIAAKHSAVFKRLQKFIDAGNKVYYLYGNHDDALLNPQVRTHVGKATGVRFLYGTSGTAKEYINKDFKVYAEHGHRFDKANFTEDPLDYKQRPVGRWIVENFVTELELIAGNDCKGPFANIDAFSPLSDYAAYIKCLSSVGKLNLADLKAFLKAAKNLIRNAPADLEIKVTARTIDTLLTAATINPLNRFKAIMVIKEFPFPSNVLGYGNIDPDKAKTLVTPLNGDPQCVVAGHTHFERIDSIGDQQIYINTGTWMDKQELDENNPCTPRKLNNRHLTLLVRTDPKVRKPFVNAYMYYFRKGPIRRFKKPTKYILK